MVKRQFPKPSEIFDLLHFKTPTLNAKKRRLDNSLTAWNLREVAKRRTPKAAFDYTDGAAESELSPRRARRAFQGIEFHPDVLHPAEDVGTSCEISDGPSSTPFDIAPMGFTQLMQTKDGITGADAARAAGIPFTLSTLGTTSTEDVKTTNPHSRNWFQLYVIRKREVSYVLAERAKKVGFDTLMSTVSTPVADACFRDKHNGFSIPPQTTLRTVLGAVFRPRW